MAKISAYVGQNTSYQSNIGQNENIGIGIVGRYVGANISVSVLAKNISRENISVLVLAGPISVQPYPPDMSANNSAGVNGGRRVEYEQTLQERGPPSVPAEISF